ncbi:type II toxin-antitoxin system PemK/MazF family toxin [Glycomyces buryatensis]|uniref:Type II toxin-antitoxin system PemK/MazF family toxin n=1 Tax=Glycomyces buryatensis TaxID=2570927 RepID=A0A4S8QBT2_9ACTN|nr:type II toxin-antitoxin system PemK/MazF family toxin [Glycomyces buryatensis]THV41740.1 type II toxin-antitoxin system PemK/MazF family toxin [Glycomyces buryatensis]
MIRGAIYPIDLGEAKRGHEQRGRRFGLVISVSLDGWSTVTVIPTSTRAKPAAFRPEIAVAGRDTRLLVDQMRSIDTQYVTGGLIDFLNQEDMEQVEYAVIRYLGLAV